MRTPDLLGFALRSLNGARTRTLLMLLAMSIGVASVVLLTALGEGARRYVVGEFAQLGTHLLIMLPGRSETTGGAPPLLGATPRDLTLDDAMALLRERSILRVAPLTVGNAPVSHGSREREVTVIGATADFFPIRHLTIGSGSGLPALDPGRGASVVVIGSGLRRELFGSQRALGQWVRIDDRRFRVIGILGEGGESLGQDLDDMAVIPVASAQVVFDTPSLFRVLIQARSEDDIERAKKAAREIIRERHDGEDDVTIISQDALLSTFDKILGALTYTVGGIAAISLAVAGILIMNVMLVSVSQRVAEIGLLKALGAPERQVLRLFLVESVMLATAGAAVGVLIAVAGIFVLRGVFPTFPIAAPLWATPAAVGVAIVTGLVFGVLPARRRTAGPGARLEREIATAMRLDDLFHLTGSAVLAHRTRSLLTGLGFAVGIAAVVLLTAIGEGVQRFVVKEFTQFGTNLIAISPGKTETLGMSGAVISNVRPLSLDDADALCHLPQVRAVVPFIQGNAEVEADGKTRRTTVFGTGHAVPEVWQIAPALGRFLPDDEPRQARAFAVLGSKLRSELFAGRSPLGERIRVGGETYRIIGTMHPKGQLLGFDLDDTVYIPIGRAMAMFDRESLMEVDVLYRADADADELAEQLKARLVARHGTEDFTIVTQDQMLEVLGSVLDVLTLAVGALGAISLLVGGIGILTIMTISVNERTGEVGLLRALGAGRRQVMALFLGEAVVLSGVGGLTGLLLGIGGAWLISAAVPGLPTHIAWDYVSLALLIAVGIGLLAGVVPALRAAGLDPVTALRAE